ncbi:DMT family transporter [Candidatus Woesearchaeota archaeon]|nr:DMT family transporter [Candidatus Woesearchaeota archaeon]
MNIFLPFFTALFFAGSFIAGKYTTYDLGPLTTSFLRYVVALIFLSFLIFYYKPKLLYIQKKHLILFSLLGISGIVLYHYFFFSSLHYTSVTNTAILNAFIPILTGIGAAFFLKERLTKKNYVGVLLSFLGVLLLLTKGNLTVLLTLNFNFGDLLMLLAVLCSVFYTLLIKHLSKVYHSFTITFYASLTGVFFLFFLSLFEGGITQLQTISMTSFFSILYMGIFASGIGHLLFNMSIHKLGATKTSSFVYTFVPVFVAILSFLFFEEILTLSMIGSIVLIVLGLHFLLPKKDAKDKKLLKKRDNFK